MAKLYSKKVCETNIIIYLYKTISIIRLLLNLLLYFNYMKQLLKSKIARISIAIILIAIVIFLINKSAKNNGVELITAEVSRGDVKQVVSVSGVVEANNATKLAFPTSGKVVEVLAIEGDIVTAGQILIYLEQSALIAEKQNAYASLLIAKANKDELINGPSDEERDVTNTNVRIAKENLSRTIAEEDEKVRNAKRTLLSTSLEMLPIKSDNNDTAPTVSGTYNCDAGTYTLSIYPSNAVSGYSYRLSGIESGTYTAYMESPSVFGECGLSIQFIKGGNYKKQDWTIEIPNTRSSSYATNLNAYNLAKQLKVNNIESAKQSLKLAEDKQTLENTAPRNEALQRANANIMKAEASLAVINANIKDRTLIAPFGGTITKIDILPGEIVTTEPVVTVLADDTFEITAQIPEIDITKINIEQLANVVFDARTNETFLAKIILISPLATEIDGVAYFESKIRIDETPKWLRGGLNADIDIIIDKKENVLRIPKRFLIENGDEESILLLKNNESVKTKIEVGFIGNDGFIEITGLNEGDIVVAP